jgi:cytochrome c oxidase cbb3-type subunit I
VDRQEQRRRPHPDQSRDGADDRRACEAKTSASGSNCYTTGAVSSPGRFTGSRRFSETRGVPAGWLTFTGCSCCIRFAANSNRCLAFNASSVVAFASNATSSVRTSFTSPDYKPMNATGIPLKEPAVSAAAGATDQLERAYIDASTRVPVLMFYTSAMAWLILGTLLAGFVSFKLHEPDLLSNISFLTWGRVRPAHMNVMVYGWASMAGMGTAIWLMARLCRTVLRYPLLLVAAAGFWNLGVLLGVGGILLGDSTGYQWLEFPGYAAIILFVAYTLIASWAVLMFRYRRGEQIYITQWYLLGAFLWFPWLYAAGQLMLFVVPVQGVLQSAVGWWYANNLLFLWFGAIALGTAYYMIPKVIGRPVYSYHLATIGFWTYALFSSWTGMQRLVDGPFPAWMITASIAAMILSMIPVATVGLNHHMTMQGYFPLMRYSPTLRFTVFGAMSYTVFSVIGLLISLRSVARYVNFSQTSIAYSHLGLYAFFTMVIFGSMYYIVPRLVGREWRYASLIKLHFWASAYGIGLMTLMLLAGGFLQGADMENPSLPFSETVETVLPYLRGRSLAGILLTAAHFIFAYHFGLMLLGLGRTSTVPTFLNPVEAETSGGH